MLSKEISLLKEDPAAIGFPLKVSFSVNAV